MKIIRLLPVLFTQSFAIPAQAEIYKWVDSAGKTHFTASKPTNPAAMIQQFEVHEGKTAPATTAGIEEDSKPAQTIAAPQVDLYVTSWCPYCKKAMAFLRSNNISFNAYDIEQDFAAAERKKQLAPDYSGIPLAVINGVQIRGFDAESYKAALAKKPR